MGSNKFQDCVNIPEQGEVFHKISFRSEDAVPRVGFESEYCAYVTQGFVRGGKSKRQARSVV